MVYGALFAYAGIHLPFWPVWLADRGVSVDGIGVLLGAGMWVRVVSPGVGAWADRTGNARAMIVVLATAALACLVAFDHTYGFAGLLALSVAIGLCIAPITPLVDGIAVHAMSAGRIDYGRVRLWGSATFIAASVLGGRWLQDHTTATVIPALQVTIVLVGLSALWFRPSVRPATSATVSWREVLRQPRLGTFLVAVALLQGSHAVLYAFGTKHWLSLGIDESTIGWLWGVSVFAEIVLFAVGRSVLERLGPAGLLLVSAVGGVLRWSLLAEVERVVPSFAVQLLHAATFGAMHLGAINWMRGNVDPAAVHRVTALYGAIAGGVALGTCMPLAGLAYEHHRGAAYYAMTALAAGGGLFAWRLRRRR